MNLNYSSSFKDFSIGEKSNFACSIYLSGGKRYGHFPRIKDINHIRVWSNSLKNVGINGVIFHNCFTKEEILSFNEFPVSFIQVPFSSRMMSGLYRFELYNNFINQFRGYIDSVFFTDSTDLDFLQNPFTHEEFDRSKIYVGYECVTAGNKWMIGACRGFKKYIELLRVDENFANRPLLNAGCIGGSVESVAPLIKRMHEECSKMYPISYVQDMPILNYLAYTEFKDKVTFGKRVNTVFTAYEKENDYAWVRHK